MDPSICAAIRERKLLAFAYGDGGRREVEPYCYGVSTSGREILRAYQVAGESRSGQPVGWKIFEVARIRSLQVLDAFPGPRPGYRGPGRAMAEPWCCF